MTDDKNPQEYTNRLAGQNSPYLLQHARNPVDWFPWSQEAFETAKRQNKPIFLSIGYSTCHWCHVMEEESFSSKKIADIMNEHFVSIKVDREERPDIDSVYMDAVQKMTGTGGWPLSVFITPDGKPFYGGTYFPPADTYGHTGFSNILLTIAKEWENRSAEIIDAAESIKKAILKLNEQTQSGILSPALLDNAKSQLKTIFDHHFGGFGTAPKFPQTTNLSMLLHYYHRTGDKEALSMVEITLDAMSKGGIYDHVGGGFHRYSTDTYWLVPHFEKMLYDQALISSVYIEAYLATGKETYAQTAREIFDYVLRDMCDACGGFYSAEDADSQGKEGAFYIWERRDIENILGHENAEIFTDYYGITEKGNYEHSNILNITKSIKELAEKFGHPQAQMQDILQNCRQRLLEYRSKRPRPGRDDKIITGWNGLMISAMACGGAALNEQKYLAAAKKCADFLLHNLYRKDRLMRYYRNRKTRGLATLDDYAFTALAMIDLYEAAYDPKWLDKAKKLTEQMIDLFSDENSESFYLTGDDAEQLIIRERPSYDSAIPCGNSAAAMLLLKLGRLTMDRSLIRRAKILLNSYSGRLSSSPLSLSAMLAALDLWLGAYKEIVIAGDYNKEDTKQMLQLVHSSFLPNAVVLFHQPSDTVVEKIIPYIHSQVPIDGKTAAYICSDYVCKQPITDIFEFEQELARI